MCKEVIINGKGYVPKEEKTEGMEYCMVRTFTAGVFAGYLASREGKEVTLLDARRMWKWVGAASLSQLANDGPSLPESCKFPCAVKKVLLLEVIEIIPITEKAKKSIEQVPIWVE